MASEIEERAIDLVNKIISNPDLPRERIKTMSLRWEQVFGELVPNLDVEFYEEKET